MQIPIKTTQDLGLLIRAVRKTSKLRMDDLPVAGPVFIRHVERGKETAQIGRVLQLLDELGIRLVADVPKEVSPILEWLRQRELSPHQKPTKHTGRS